MSRRGTGRGRLVTRIAVGAAVLAGTALAALQAWRIADDRAAAAAWRHLATPPVHDGVRFDPAMVAGLPEPARRFFQFAIRPGTLLATVAEITMDGELSLGSKQEPGYQPMHARQILAAPRGLVWRVEMGRGLVHLSGSDVMDGDRSWTRFWLVDTLPIARAGGDRDHLRSSFGRIVAEAMFWSPAALLPQANVRWEAMDANTARATVTDAGMQQDVVIHVDAAGRPLWVSMRRWSNANADGVFRLQPFGGDLSDFREVQGYQLPFRVDGGNFFGTPDYFPFYRAQVREIRLR